MHIAVFGATTKVGKSVVVKLLEQNHTVTVFEDGANPFINHPGIRIVQGDTRDASDIARALEGADVVISAAGGLGVTADANLAPTMRTILEEMEQRNIWRIIALGNVVTYIEGDHPSFVGRQVYRLYKTMMPKVLRDSEDQIRFLQSSKADWTIVRAPNLRSRGRKGSWKLSLHPTYPWHRIHAEDVAQALVDQLTDTHFMNQAPFISGG